MTSRQPATGLSVTVADMSGWDGGDYWRGVGFAGEGGDGGGDLVEGGVEVAAGDGGWGVAGEGLGDGVASDAADGGDGGVTEHVGGDGGAEIGAPLVVRRTESSSRSAPLARQ